MAVRGVVVDRDDESALTPNLASAVQTNRVPVGGIQATGDRGLCFPGQVRRREETVRVRLNERKAKGRCCYVRCREALGA